MELDKDTLREMYQTMVTIRMFEDRVKEEFAKGRIPGFVHLYAGEEAVATGVMANLRDSDKVTSTHRGHGHCVAKGCDVNGMMAEIFGKATGLCKGKGGSMHIADVSKGMLGANGIVGGGPPLACGAALTAKVMGTDDVCICFFGDGAAEQGTFHESMNLASIWKLPVVFVAENNGFAESTPASYHCAIENIAERAGSYGIPGAAIDGMDVFAVYEATKQAVERARRGEGPSLLEFKTYRYFGHFEGDQQLYKTPELQNSMKERDPITYFRKSVTEQGLLTNEELDKIERKVAADIDGAVAFADSSPYPALDEVTSDVYVSYR
ncbi:MAG TPA: thiamine pyrophosphate-dependent dehydrogenase E1 component subunit alpha [Chloroflexia bacterium]|nr:thiamine pyrophosphate-dependent dehydrogenase E1 component subunit alpha [Chloroflexia bacterium]